MTGRLADFYHLLMELFDMSETLSEGMKRIERERRGRSLGECMDGLEDLASHEGWVCRDSFTGRRLRIHEISQAEADAFGLDCYPSIQEAVEAYLSQRG